MAKPKAKAKAKPTAKPIAKPKPKPIAKPKPKPIAKPKPKPIAKPKPAPKPTSKSKAPAAPPPPAWQSVVDALGTQPGVARRGMFGNECLNLGGKAFAMTWKGDLVVKLPRTRVDALAAAGTGVHFDPGMGRPMREWLRLAHGALDWVAASEEAMAFVGSLPR